MSSDEEDYMSDKFLQKCSDTRPGLVPKKLQEQYEKDKKQKEANRENKTISKQKLEASNRETGLGTSISTESKGFAMLQKMGYKPGMGIGKQGTGRTEPVSIEVKNNRLGLGKDTEMKRRASEMNSMRKMMETKRQKVDETRKENFRDRMKDRFSSQSVERDLKLAQNVCLQLDQEQGIEEPGELFFWPPSFLSSLQSEEDEEPELVGEDNAIENYDDVDEKECSVSLEFSEFERLDILNRYLRNTYFYCIWCGIKFVDKQDLETNCPGNTKEAHD